MKSRQMPPNLLLVCMGGACRKHGAKRVLHALEEALDARGACGDCLIQRCGCMGRCDEGPNVMLYPWGQLCSGVKRRHAADILEMLGAPECEHAPQCSTPANGQLDLELIHVELEAP